MNAHQDIQPIETLVNAIGDRVNTFHTYQQYFHNISSIISRFEWRTNNDSLAMEFGCEGLKMDWDNYTPTKSALPSIWGHKFQM